MKNHQEPDYPPDGGGELSPQYIGRCRKALMRMGAPLEGWECIRVDDYESDTFVCELCGCTNVRYVHVMAHRDYPELISVGCICAGVMEDDILAAMARDNEARRRSRRKKYYLSKAWIGGYGCWSLEYKGRDITIRLDSFRGHEFYEINIDGDRYQWKDNRRMTSFEDARRYVFDLIEEGL